MTLQELIDETRALMNRDDLTDAQIKRFVLQAITFNARILRLPVMEKQLSHTIVAGSEYVTIPADYIELKQISADGKLLDFMDFNYLNSLSKVSGTPQYFSRSPGKWVFSPQPAAGAVIDLIYYGKPVALVNPGDTNVLTEHAEDAVLYCALVKACEFTVDERKDQFDAAFQKELLALTEEANKHDYTGGVYAVRPVTTNY